MLFSRDCGRVKELLWDLASGKATREEEALAEEHFKVCERCRTECSSYQETAGLIAAYKSVTVPASRAGWRDVQRRIAEQEATSRPLALRALFNFTVVGASVAAVATVGMFVMHASTGTSTVSQSNGVAASGGPSMIVARQNGPDGKLAAPETGYSSGSIAGLSIIDNPSFTEPAGSSKIALRSSAPIPGLRVARNKSRNVAARATQPGYSSSSQDLNMDGGGSGQSLQPAYVLASASSGSEDDQNRRYVIDVVSTTSSSVGADSNEDTHPW